MEGGRCIIRPPTTPASNIIVTLEPEKAEQAAFLTGSSSFVLIGFVTGKFSILFQLGSLAHTAGLDTIFVQIYMDPPPGVQAQYAKAGSE